MVGLSSGFVQVDMKDRKDISPVITPCYPGMNSTYNVSKATIATLHEEWKRGVCRYKAVASTGHLGRPIARRLHCINSQAQCKCKSIGNLSCTTFWDNPPPCLTTGLV